MELHDALTQIAEIRRQMAKAEVFPGYRSASVAFSGLLAIGAAVAQSQWIVDPSAEFGKYLTLWIAVAALSIAGVALEMSVRYWRMPDRSLVEPTRLAVEQFVPSVAAGILVTAVLSRHVPHAVPLLPGLWQILFSLGIFASARLLPRAVYAVGGFYFVCGVLALMSSPDAFSLSPWWMGVPFAAGQLATAAILYWNLERRA